MQLEREHGRDAQQQAASHADRHAQRRQRNVVPHGRQADRQAEDEAGERRRRQMERRKKKMRPRGEHEAGALQTHHHDQRPERRRGGQSGEGKSGGSPSRAVPDGEAVDQRERERGLAQVKQYRLPQAFFAEGGKRDRVGKVDAVDAAGRDQKTALRGATEPQQSGDQP